MRIGAFEAIMADSAFQDLPFSLEVPGLESKGSDVQNIDLLKDIRQCVSLTG